MSEQVENDFCTRHLCEGQRVTDDGVVDNDVIVERAARCRRQSAVDAFTTRADLRMEPSLDVTCSGRGWKSFTNLAGSANRSFRSSKAISSGTSGGVFIDAAWQSTAHDRRVALQVKINISK